MDELKRFLEKKFYLHPLDDDQINKILSLVDLFELKEIYIMIDVAYKKIIIEYYDCSPTKNANADFLNYLCGIVKNKQKNLFDKRRDYIINVIKITYPQWEMYIVKKSIYDIFDKLKANNISDEKLITLTSNIVNTLYNKYDHFESFYEFEDVLKVILDIPIY